MACRICNEEDCDHQITFPKISKKQFSGSSPPEIFIGRHNYPNVYTGILAPEEYGDTSIMSSPEEWHSKQLAISDITQLRNRLIYARTKSHIKIPQSRFLETMREIAMTSKSIATEFKLKQTVKEEQHPDPRVPLIARAANAESVRLEENPIVKPKVDYLVNDIDAKSTLAIKELYKSNIPVTTIMKLLSAGLLGIKKNRRLVPTRWSITAVDDTLSKEKLEKIRQFQEISEIQVFSAEYLGNHYEFLLFPDKYSFEVIEISTSNGGIWHDFESFFPRKKYADEVTGAYYANRLALTEYLQKIKRQAQCLVIREIRPEYNAPCGVGILREVSREAFSNFPKKFNTKEEALKDVQSRLHLPIDQFISKSWLLENFGKQKRLTEFFQ